MLLPIALLAAGLSGQGVAASAAAGSPCPHAPPGALRWSDAASWPGGALPARGECVAIAAGTTIWLDVSPPPLGGLSIDGELVFACTDLALVADSITVRGKLEVGSTQHPFHRDATLTLTRDFACSPKAQTLAVEPGGVLRLIGVSRGWSWLRLGQNAPAGSAMAVLERASGWQAGDRVVLASTDFDAHQAEVRTIVAASGTVLQLDAPLAWPHFGETVAANVDGVGVDERGEVGLLTRRIVVRGVPSLDALGRVRSGAVVARGGGAVPRVQIAWTAFQDLGDEGVLDRHPLQLDSLGEAAGSFVRGASFERSSNRAIAIRASDHVAIEKCVAADTLGHAFYVEDHATRGTILRQNLGLLTRAATPGFEVTASDLLPATFRLRHPDAICEENVAAGSDAYGFRIDVADGETTPQKWFAKNVAHSCERIGFFQDTRPRPASPSVWSDLGAWKNRRYGVWWRSYGSIALQNLRAADNRCAVYLASEGIQNDFVQVAGIADLRVEGGLIVGESKNVGVPATAVELAVGRSLPQLAPNPQGAHLPDWDVLCGVELYDGLLSIDGTAFANFYDAYVPGVIDRKAGAFGQAQHNSPWAIDPRNHAADLSFSKARRVWFRTPLGAYAVNPTLGDDGIASTGIVDDDGSLTGIAGSRVFAAQPLVGPPAGATFDPSWNAFVTAGAPAEPFAQLELANWMPLVNGQAGAPLVHLRREATAAAHELVMPIWGAQQTHTDRYTANVSTGEGYAYEYDVATPMAQWSSVFSVSLQFTEPGRWVQVSVPLPPIAGGTVEIDGTPAYAAASLADLAAAPSGYFYDAVTGRVHLKLTTGGSGSTIFDGLRTTATVVAY